MNAVFLRDVLQPFQEVIDVSTVMGLENLSFLLFV
jgi:hypothetical protein